MTQDEVKLMIEQAPGLEIASLVAFLYLFGSRIGEALQVTVSDIIYFDEALTIGIRLEKKRKAETAPIAWKHPLTVKRNEANKVFVDLILSQWKLGTEGRIWGISRITAWKKIKALNPMCSPHIFRHTRNRRLVEQGAGALDLQDWNGWADPRPASNYLGLSGNLAKRFSDKID